MKSRHWINRVVTAKLIKKETANGLMSFKDDVPLGKIYKVDLDTRMVKTCYNLDKGNFWELEMIEDVENGGWLPTELLEIESPS